MGPGKNQEVKRKEHIVLEFEGDSDTSMVVVHSTNALN